MIGLLTDTMQATFRFPKLKGQKGKKFRNFIFASNWSYYPIGMPFQADFEINDNFDQILKLILYPFSSPIRGYNSVESQFQIIHASIPHELR